MHVLLVGAIARAQRALQARAHRAGAPRFPASADAAGMLIIRARAARKLCSEFAQQPDRSGKVARCRGRTGECIQQLARAHSADARSSFQASGSILIACLRYARGEGIERVLSHRLDQCRELSLAGIETSHRCQVFGETAPVRRAMRNERAEARHYTPQRDDQQEAEHDQRRQRVFRKPAGQGLRL
jgi:hypothetical protein